MSNDRQDNNPRASAEQVWKSLLEDLKQTPLEIPETWTKDTSAHWDSEELSLIVTVPLDTNEIWLARRFLPLAKIYFGQGQEQKHLVVQRKGRVGQDDLLVRVQRSVYDQVVDPNKLVPVQIYMFQHWLPVLGAAPFWVAAAMRQVSFVAIAEDDSVLKPISSRVLAKWAPLKHVQVSEWLNKKGFSSWFYKKVKDGYEDVPPEYTVWSQIPLAPHHLVWIENFINQYKDEESAASILESLLDRTSEIRRVKPGDVDIPSSISEKRRTVLDVVSEYFPGKISKNVSELENQLVHQITRPNLAVTIPHYFYKKYMDELSPNEAALIWYLRSLYREDESAEVHFSGYRSLEIALGCGNRTPKRLIEKCMHSPESGEGNSWETQYSPELSLSNWLSAEYKEEYKKGYPREYSIKIRATEPIHNDDIGYFNRLLKGHLESSRDTENDSNKGAQIRTEGTQNQTGDEQKYRETKSGSDSEGTQFRTGDAQNLTGDTQIQTGEEQSQTGNPRISEHYNNSNTNKSLTNSFNNYLIPLQPDTSDPELSTDTTVVGIWNINLDKLLGFGSYKHNEKKKIIVLIKKTPELFLAWIIRNHITAAKFPVRLAVKNLQEGNSTEDQYLELARLGWEISAQLASVYENDLSMWELGLDEDYEDQEELIQAYKKLSKPAKKGINKLRETDYSQLVENVK
ncbi:MAG: hypothetical protein WBB64_10130 [Anaerolineales bacterium]